MNGDVPSPALMFLLQEVPFMRSRRVMSVALLLLVGFLCAMQTNAQSYVIHGFYREWHNAAGQVIGYEYKYCNGQVDSWGFTIGAPTTSVSLSCGVINQRAPVDNSLVPTFCGPFSGFFPPVCDVTNPH
jgi:hypothetical protein